MNETSRNSGGELEYFYRSELHKKLTRNLMKDLDQFREHGLVEPIPDSDPLDLRKAVDLCSVGIVGQTVNKLLMFQEKKDNESTTKPWLDPSTMQFLTRVVPLAMVILGILGMFIYKK